jgi:hypothetical protein
MTDEPSGGLGTATRYRVPLVPKLVAIMSIPLYLGYLIKHALLPEGLVFVVAYGWAVASFAVVPLLCVGEAVFLVSAACRRGAETRYGWHAAGLGIGVAAVLAALTVR